MDESKLKAEITELLKKHAKPSEEVPEPIRSYFTEDKMDEMIERLTQIIADHAKNTANKTEG